MFSHRERAGGLGSSVLPESVTDTTDALTGGPLLAAVSNELVRLYRTHFGRGPTQARTALVDDTLICQMSDPFTTTEKTLIGIGRGEQVAAMRRSVREALADEFNDAIEALTRRRVIAHVSGVHCSPDLSIEVFVLQPGNQDG
jgi:uncharacterized protein YbcI